MPPLSHFEANRIGGVEALETGLTDWGRSANPGRRTGLYGADTAELARHAFTGHRIKQAKYLRYRYE